MTAGFGHRWTSNQGEDFANLGGKLWARELAGMKRQQIEAGLKTALRDEWPPVLSAFRSYCLGAIPKAAVMLDRKLPREQRGRFTRLVESHLDEFTYRQSDRKQQERMLTDAYDMAREYVLDGKPLPSDAPDSRRLAHTRHVQEPAPGPRMSADDAVAQMRTALNMPVSGEGVA